MKSIVISLTDLIKYKKYLFKSDISVHAQIEIYLFNLIFIAINAIMFAHQILYLLFCNVMKLLNKQVIIHLDIYLIPKLLLSEFLIFSVILIATFCRKKHLLKNIMCQISLWLLCYQSQIIILQKQSYKRINCLVKNIQNMLNIQLI